LYCQDQYHSRIRKNPCSSFIKMFKYNKLAGKHVLVIGGSKGIGRGVVEASLEAGACVTLVGSSQKSADTAVSDIKTTYTSADLVGLGCDLSHEDTVEEDLEALFQKAGSVQAIDHVVFTAADGLTISPLAEISKATICRATHMRLVVPVLVGKTAMRHLAKTPESSLTLTTGSIADGGRPGWSLMAYMGAGTTGLARNMALDLRPIRVNAVEPGLVDTPLWDNASMTAEQKAKFLREAGVQTLVGRAGRVEDVAEAYLYLMKDGNCTGEVIKTRSGAHLI
jgi:NAD(P)-dependent dehydrogenase (short-subunit alcohol dehydrogenase family)